MLEHVLMFAHYNRWANQRLYAEAAKFSPVDWTADRGAFFGSMQGTLNHIVVADRIWMRRFTGEGPVHARLNGIPYPDFAELQDARNAEDERIIAFAKGLSEDRLTGTFSYTPLVVPTPVTQRLFPALCHFFNHQTHHRGQASAILTGLGYAMPELDLIYFHRMPEGKVFA